VSVPCKNVVRNIIVNCKRSFIVVYDTDDYDFLPKPLTYYYLNTKYNLIHTIY